MPCYDPGPTPSELIAEAKKAKAVRDEHLMLEAALCGIFTLAEKTCILQYLMDQLDYDEMGVSKDEVLNWWKKHKKKDEKRKREEEKKLALQKEKERLEELKSVALNKLSKDERKALGLQD